jgi:hypothetical protein
MMISIETYMTDNEASVLENLPGEWPTEETTGVTDAGMDGFLPPRATRRQPDYADFVCL